VRIINGDCLKILNYFESCSIDSIVTDPPYGLSKEPDISKVLSCWLNDEDYHHTHKGFSGNDWDSFVPNPKVWKLCYRVLKPGAYTLVFGGTRTYDLTSIALRLAGFEIRDTISWNYSSGMPKSLNVGKHISTHEGWGTGLKPAHEPIILARKPISETRIVENVERWNTGALNIDKSRVPVENSTGRYPSNWIHDGSDEVLSKYPYTRSGKIASDKLAYTSSGRTRLYGGVTTSNNQHGDEGSAARFFYCAKISTAERDFACENNHPTVKPINLMKYLVNLITPTNGIVLDPFMGSGSTGLACLSEGFDFVGIELNENYFEISKKRLQEVLTNPNVLTNFVFNSSGKNFESEKNSLV
jgi:site-specific DNA-methyltransferase (adenine-specific)